MAVTATPYGKAAEGLGNAEFDFGADTFKFALTTVTYVPNVDTDEFFDDVTNEIVGTGYTAGGKTLTGLVWAYDAANNRAVLTCDTPSWTGATFTTRRGVAYKSTGVAGTSRLLSWVDFGADESPVAITFEVTFVDGLFRATVA